MKKVEKPPKQSKKDSIVQLAKSSNTTVTAAATPEAQKDDAQMVDFLSSFIFPIVFLIFNIIYWVIYLNMQVESNN